MVHPTPAGLRLPTAPYCDGACPERNLSKVVDSRGRNAGLGTFIEAMLATVGAPFVHHGQRAYVWSALPPHAAAEIRSQCRRGRTVGRNVDNDGVAPIRILS